MRIYIFCIIIILVISSIGCAIHTNEAERNASSESRSFDIQYFPEGLWDEFEHTPPLPPPYIPSEESE